VTPHLPAVALLVLPNAVACVLAVVAACGTTGSRWQRAMGLVVGIGVLGPAWLLPISDPLFRGFSALLAFSWTMRIVDLGRGQWTLRDRIAHVASVVDTRRLMPSRARLDTRGLVAGSLWVAPAIAAFVLLRASPSFDPIQQLGARWGGALVFVYCALGAGYALGHATYAALGFETGPLHVHPIFSRSVQELWGERWARPVSLWLRETFFRPLARRRHILAGALLAFSVSAAFHAYVVWVALGFTGGLTMAGWMLAYFVAQALVVGLERVLGVKRWAPWCGRLWTLGWMLATAPLFLEPGVRVFGLQGR
jgi:hypothetical protein